MELWSRPWGIADLKKRYRRDLGNGDIILGPEHRGSLWVYAPTSSLPVVNGSTEAGVLAPGFGEPYEKRNLIQLPLPVGRRPPISIKFSGRAVSITWQSLPPRPQTKHPPQTDEEHAGHRLFLRARAVWDRLKDVDTALADPARLWEELRRRWTTDEDIEPQLDVIVRHAVILRRVLDELDRAPRRILRRTHRQIPLARVQELDRRSMTWLVRQPGTSLAERAGDRQSILAVAREENFDTLENRVLRAYGELAASVASEYLERNSSKKFSRRARLVEAYGKRSKHLARDLSERGVRLAEPGVMPNFVLQQNPRYHKIWNAWDELIKRERENDELWRWQARSWEEFGALAVMVSLVGIHGARLVASAPLTFLDEQDRGRWVDHDNPLGVFYLSEQGLVVEVYFGMARPGASRADFAAPIWINVGRANAADGFLSSIPVWPIWDQKTGLAEGEASDLQEAVALGKKSRLTRGLVIRPAEIEGMSESDETELALVLTMGTQGQALHDAIERMSNFFASLIKRV